MQKAKEFFKTGIYPYLEAVLKWGLMGVVTGCVGGAVGTAFHHSITAANEFRAAQPWILYLLPVAGLLIIFLYHRCGIRTDRGTNMVLDGVRENQPIPLRIVFLMFVATTLTQLCGGSAGREGAALQIGGGVGSFLNQRGGKKLGLGVRSQKVGVMCGMSAVFSALFGTPITATVFSMEVIEVGAMQHLAFLPCLISSLTAFGISQMFGGERTMLTVLCEEIPLSGGLVLRTMVLAFACAMVSILFCRVVHGAFGLYGRVFKNAYVRVAAGGVLVILLTLLMGTTAYNGAGMNLVQEAAAGGSAPYTFLVKLLFTAVTLGAGFKGGEIVPSFAVGASFGCFAASVMGMEPSLGAALGLVAVFCGVVNCPFTSIILGLELCGSRYLVLFAIVAAVSLLFSGKCSLYSSQRILREKVDVSRFGRFAEPEADTKE